MKKYLALVVMTLVNCAIAQSAAPQRPKITGIDHVAFYTTAPDANRHLYTVILGLEPAEPVEAGQTQRFMVGTQWVGYSPAPNPKATDRMDHVAFTTDNIARLRSYLIAKGVAISEATQTRSDDRRSFQVLDPEGHRIEFVQQSETPAKVDSQADAVSHRMIHTGFIVRNRAAEDHFYKDILGFRPYWHGGMKDGQTDWVSIQVPDGTDWLEYMLNVQPNPSLRTTGVMNHISLGVVNMKAAEAKVVAHGWDPHGDQHVQMGKDGKWQLNLFDPDYTRVELMEFKPAQKPCCSDFQGPHPEDN